MNLIVGWKLFAFRRNSSISFLLVWHADMTSSQIFWLVLVLVLGAALSEYFFNFLFWP